MTAWRRPGRPTDGPAEIITGLLWYRVVGVVAVYLAVVCVTLADARREVEYQGGFDNGWPIWRGGWSPVCAGIARPGRALVVKVERHTCRTTFAAGARSGCLWGADGAPVVRAWRSRSARARDWKS